jgi:hypothetical protein
MFSYMVFMRSSIVIEIQFTTRISDFVELFKPLCKYINVTYLLWTTAVNDVMPNLIIEKILNDFYFILQTVSLSTILLHVLCFVHSLLVSMAAIVPLKCSPH